MKEIDLLPKWYKSGRRRQIGYRTQYAALGSVFVAMMLWNSIANHSISKTEAELAQAKSKQAEVTSASEEFARIKNEVTQLQKKTKYIEEIDSKIDVASVLAEISFLIDKKIVLSKVEFSAEKFADRQGGKAYNGSVVRVAGSSFGGKKDLPLGNVRFKVVLNGVASDGRDVAELICRLEDSPYFCQVIPSFSRNKKINPVRNSTLGNRIQKGKISNGVKTESSVSGRDLQVSEFKISCELANYLQEEKS